MLPALPRMTTDHIGQRQDAKNCTPNDQQPQKDDSKADGKPDWTGILLRAHGRIRSVVALHRLLLPVSFLHSHLVLATTKKLANSFTCWTEATWPIPHSAAMLSAERATLNRRSTTRNQTMIFERLSVLL
jgi:hypothetical protein